MNVLFPLRELQSKKRISKTVTFKDTRGITKTITLTVEGPVSVAGCTTRERIYEDNANRSFLIYLDESAEQDQRIMNYQRALSAGLINTEEETEAVNLLKNCQRILLPIAVRNPYAPQLELPKAVLKPRRTNKHYLDFIEAVTFYHQYQRTEAVCQLTGEIYIETTLEDIKNANYLLKEILLRKADTLSGACRNYFEQLKEHLTTTKQSSFTNRSTGQELRIAHSTIKRYHLQLLTAGLIKLNQNKKEKTHWYEITSTQEYEELKSSINNILDEVLQKIIASGGSPQLNGSNQLTKESEPVKPLKNNKKKPSAQQLTKA